MKLHIVCCQFNRGNLLVVKDRKWSNQKTDRLQKGDFHDERFDRG